MNSQMAGQLSARDQQELLKHLELEQLKSQTTLYNHVISECFENCCQTGWRGFSSKSLEASEKACLDKCAQKYFLLFQRVGFRFAEMNAQKTQEQMMQQGQK
eukprot:CAMPEP_0118854010 /NCGR_PEP_ID=MMETSP1163-20130328/2383_1 /TAXON_ID=124430 /ORGANISM="Phaeomonas parva, Strain CCMP2877" /LENGTH=101 /DNA_ID=CAMNT_0006786661 /DNA_START=82 /DNA_END=387 /DNA_ORIENTATION=-